MIESSSLFSTDTATLAIFDPQLLYHRMKDPHPDWWTDRFSEIPECQNGQLLLIDLGSDGTYTFRITSGELSIPEKAYARKRLGAFPFVVASGFLFIGAGEELPAAGVDFDPNCEIYCIMPGDYSVQIFWIAWRENGTWWTEGDRSPEAPPDIVIRVEAATMPGIPPRTEADLYLRSEAGFLFPELDRVVGPVPGMFVNSQVRMSKSGLVLSHAGPLLYRPMVSSLEGLRPGQRVRLHVLEVDHSNKTFKAEIQVPEGGHTA